MPTTNAAPPTGFREHASGLIVPAELSRERQIWTREEWKLLNRVTKMLDGHGVSILLKCDQPACKAAPIQALRLPSGDFRLRCAHADRVMTKAF